MKKLLLFNLFIALFFSMQAQISLGTAHIPQMGDKLYIGIDSTEYWYDNPDYNLSTGEDKAWSFDLIQIEDTQVRTYKPASEGSAPADFPDAEMIGPFLGGEGYYKQDADGLRLLGYYGSPTELLDLDLSVEFDPDYTVLPAGMTYGDTVTTEYAFDEEINEAVTVEFNGTELTINGAKLKVTSTVEYVADGWGTFTTPYGTWDVLRVVQTEYRHTEGEANVLIFGWQDLEALGVDGFGYDTLRTIMFINDQIKEPIIEFEIDNDGPHAANSPARAIRFKIPENLVVDVETLETKQEMKVVAYPNPAVNDLSLSMIGFTPGMYYINVFNMIGRTVMPTQLVEITGDSSIRMNISDLNKGIYLYNITDAFGNILTTKRLVVVKP